MLTGVIAPALPWDETVTWAKTQRERGVDSLWFTGADDAVVIVGALSQVVPGIRFGITDASLRNRPHVLAAKQLATLDLVTGGRVDVGLGDPESFFPIAEALLGPYRPSPAQDIAQAIWRFVLPDELETDLPETGLRRALLLGETANFDTASTNGKVDMTILGRMPV